MKQFRISTLLVAGGFVCSFASAGKAQNWIGTGSSTYSWNDAVNWSGGIVPNTNSAVATFSNAANSDTFTVNLPTNITLQTLAFNANQTGTVTVGSTGGILTLATNGNENAFVVDAGSGNHVINLDVLVAGSNNAASRLWQVNGNATLTVNGSVGQASNPRAIGKTGTGTVIITGNNTFSGGFQLTAGQAYINNTTGSGTGTGAVSVAAGSTLGGTGTIAGALTVSSSGRLAPGNSGPTAVGNLTVANDVTLLPSAEFVVRLNSATEGGYDRLTSTGNVILTGSTLTASVGSGYTPVAGQKLFIIVNSGAGSTTPTFNGLAEGATLNIGGFDFQIHYGANFEAPGQPLTTGNDVALTPVPEPTTVLGIAAAGAFAMTRLRRRFKA